MKTITNLNIKELKVKTVEELAIDNFPDAKTLSIKIGEEQHKRLKILAFCTGTTMSAIVRAFLEQFVEQYRKENVIDGEPESQD